MKVSAQIHQRMLDEIQKHGFEVIWRYPDDINHDKLMLESVEVKGMQVAWVVGHAHTHLVRLGLHKKENEMVNAMLNMSEDDRFYVFTFESEGYKCKELNRNEFAALANTKIKYSAKFESDSGFNLFKGDDLIASVSTEIKGNYRDQVKEGRYQLKSEHLNAIDLAAIEMWTYNKLSNLTGSLFGNYDVQLSN